MEQDISIPPVNIRPATEIDTAQIMIFIRSLAKFEKLAHTLTATEDDLYVDSKYRRSGVGEALIRHCAKIAKERDCGTMDWVVLD